jgi:hypothetical protein
MAEAGSTLKRTLWLYSRLRRAPFHVLQVESIGVYQKLLKRENLSLLQSSRYISFDYTASAATSSSGIESGGNQSLKSF